MNKLNSIAPARPLAILLSVLLILSNVISGVAMANALPNIVHLAPDGTVSSAEPFAIVATVTDDTGIKAVTIYYRLGKDANFIAKPMRSSANGVYSYIFPTSDLIPPSIDYYIEAEDSDGEKQLRGFDFDPLVFNVAAPIAATPVSDSGARKVHPAIYVLGGLLVVGLAVAAVGGDEEAGPVRKIDLSFQ